MTIFQAVLLGTLQGITEFLPVSSSGHLVLLQHFLGLREPALLFDIMVHVATLFAVLSIYHGDIRQLLGSCWRPWRRAHRADSDDREAAQARWLGLMVLAASVPTACIGLLFDSMFEQLFNTPRTVGIALLVTGTMLWSVKFVGARSPGSHTLRLWQALLLGVIQGLAITPGISRAGSTIVVAIWCGINREAAARFSFLIAIPAILGAALIKCTALSSIAHEQVAVLLIGMVSALVVGYVALRFLLYLLLRGAFWRFAVYCWLVGLVALLVSA